MLFKYMYVYVCIYVFVYMYVYLCVYVSVYIYIYISYILYICDILVIYKFSININPASWLPHANKEYYYYVHTIE